MSSTRANSSFKGHLVRSVHLRLHHIDRAGSTVALGIRARDIAQRNERGHRGIEYAFRYLVVEGVEDCVRVHVMTNIAHQHETTPWEPQLAASASGIDAVWIELAMHGSSALLECCRERAFD